MSFNSITSFWSFIFSCTSLFKILAALDEIAAQYHTNPAQVSLAWLIARPSITAPIASATDLDQLTDLINATQLKLSAETMQELNLASA